MIVTLVHGAPAFSAFLAIVVSVWVGYRFGYRHGFADSDWSHDFDRCPHCGEAPNADQP